MGLDSRIRGDERASELMWGAFEDPGCSAWVVKLASVRLGVFLLGGQGDVVIRLTSQSLF